MGERSMSEIDFVFVYGDDWEGLYANGRLVLEGHSIYFADVISYLLDDKVGPYQIRSYDSRPADWEWLEERGSLPKLLSKVKYDPEWSISSDE